MGIFDKKKTLNSSGGGAEIEKNLHQIRRTMKQSLDWQESKFKDMGNIVDSSNDIGKNLDELRQALMKQTEQFPK